MLPRTCVREPPRPLELLSHDHTRLEALFEVLMEAFRADAREDVRRLWSELERTLLGHMEAEERWVLPAFAQVDPGETAALRSEHDTLRARLADLGAGVDLHAIASSVADAFVHALRAHALRENALLYRWLEREGNRAGPSGRERIL